MTSKLKVVWLCHFANEEMDSILKPSKRSKETAPWIPIALKTIENSSDFDIYVISPYAYINGIKRFDLRGVHYTFFNPYLLHNRYFYNAYFKLDYFTNFIKAKRIVRRVIDNIKPDIIHLFGAENAYYSSSILQFYKKYPVIITVQGFIGKASIRNKFITKRIEVERQILRRTKIAFCEAKCLGEDIKQYSPDVKLFWHFYGSYEITPFTNIETKYDIVFFARISRDKGIVDLIDAISILKHGRPNIKVCIIGGNKENEFSEYAKTLGLEDNIEWTGFLKTREDVHRKAQEGLISVLPTYHDINPGTIIESMFLGIPVVSYDIPSNLEINEKGEVIKLAEYKNVNSLAENIELLLNNPSEREVLSSKAQRRAKEMFAPSNQVIRECLKKGYDEAIRLFYQ